MRGSVLLAGLCLYTPVPMMPDGGTVRLGLSPGSSACAWHQHRPLGVGSENVSENCQWLSAQSRVGGC